MNIFNDVSTVNEFSLVFSNAMQRFKPFSISWSNFWDIMNTYWAQFAIWVLIVWLSVHGIKKVERYFVAMYKYLMCEYLYCVIKIFV